MAGKSAARLRITRLPGQCRAKKAKAATDPSGAAWVGKKRGDISRETYAWGLRARSNSCWIWALGAGVSRETNRMARQLRTKAGKSS